MSQDNTKGDNVTPKLDNVDKGTQDGMDLSADGVNEYSKEYVARLKDNYFKEREKRKEAETKASELAKAKLQEDNKFKELYELEKQENEKKDKELRAFLDKEKKGKMLSAVSRKLLDLGLDPVKQSRALKLVDLNSVVYDDATDTVVGADRVAQKFYEENNDLGFFKTPTAKLDQRTTTTTVQKDINKMTKDELLRAASQSTKWN